MFNTKIYYRLVALWVVCEAMLGGIIHGLKLPVSGLFVGGAALICICMIGKYYPVRGAIIKATIIVAIFKMMLSPHSPFAAYIAVFFQGVVGELIFLSRKNFKLNCIFLGIITMLESAIQRILVMTLLFGMDIWKAINMFINGITGQNELTNYSYYLAIAYIILHLIMGFIIGFYAGKIPQWMNANSINSQFKIKMTESDQIIMNDDNKSGKSKLSLFILWIVFAGVYIYTLLYPGDENKFLSHIMFRLLFRSALIILTWIVIINPLLMRLLHRWLKDKKTKMSGDIKEITMLLPSTQQLVSKSWQLSASRNGISRLMLFSRIVVFNSLSDG